MRKILNISLYLFTLSISLLYLLSRFTGQINPNDFWPSSFIGIAFPWFYATVSLLMVIHWIKKNKKWTYLLLFLFLIGWLPFNRFYRVPHACFQDENSLNVMTYNLHGQIKIKNKNKSVLGENRSEFINFINNEGAFNVLLFQEFNFSNSDNYISNGLNMKNLIKYKKSGVAILTKHDVLDKGIIRFKNTTNAAVWADIIIDDKTIRFYSIHLQSNQVSGLVGDVIHDEAMSDSQKWNNVTKTIERVNVGASKRADQIKKVMKHINQSPYEVVVGADMNETPWTFVYNQITQNLQDAFYVNGTGSGISYAGDLPGLKIDYIFVSPNYKVLESFVAKSPFSDHFPQIAKLKSIK